MTTMLEDWWRILHESHLATRFPTDQCRRLAEGGRVGRLFWSGSTGLQLALTHYVWHADRIFLPAILADRRGAEIDGCRVAFEIDELDATEAFRTRGWSVVAAGTARLVPAITVWSDLGSALGTAAFPAHWPPGDTDQPLLRIDVDSLTGQQVNGGSYPSPAMRSTP